MAVVRLSCGSAGAGVDLMGAGREQSFWSQCVSIALSVRARWGKLGGGLIGRHPRGAITARARQSPRECILNSWVNPEAGNGPTCLTLHRHPPGGDRSARRAGAVCPHRARRNGSANTRGLALLWPSGGMGYRHRCGSARYPQTNRCGPRAFTADRWTLVRSLVL
jgi:hypothetical protein